MTLRALISSAFLFAAASSLCMASPAGDYLKQKKQITADVEQAVTKGPIEDADKLDQEALLKLEATLRKLIGPLDLQGFPAEGKIALETLEQDQEGSGGLDGLSYTATDGQRQLLVTTKALLTAWFNTNGQVVERDDALAAATTTPEFYTAAINDGAAVYNYASLPVQTGKSGGISEAILFKQGQDDVAPAAPDQIGVTEIHGDRVYVLWQKITVQDVAQCKNAFRPGRDTQESFLACFAQHLPAQPGYQALVKQAQGIVDELANAQ
ncbi:MULTISPECIES: hypothetical protein [unclassified Achromobacter]|uniref:hypothetical protein n=1 Tax=unclassified Achromobacter TaxID=2626865 RepID=UPI000B51B147|nr:MULTISPECIES: hypothetical protein [unclassified Achromobacter]OWT67974.1 hypothetical protein CEY04_30390 [Achromobacter sp. HZ28]OWT81033.1 hypothetical protein CEY05_06700 [Achromobacter sp. HZ34]